METNQYSTEAVRKWLTIGALLLTLTGYALPWYRISVSAYIVQVNAQINIWGVSGSVSGSLLEPKTAAATWFNMPSSAMTDLISVGIGFIFAFLLYVAASLTLLVGVSDQRIASASVILLFLSVVSFVATIPQLTTTEPSIIPVQQGYSEGILMAIVALLLTGGAFAIPLLKRTGQVPPSPIPPPPDEEPALEKERLSKLLEKLDERLVNGEISETTYKELKSGYLTKLKHVEEEIGESRQPVDYAKLRDLLISYVTKKFYGTTILPIENVDKLVLIVSETLSLPRELGKGIVTDKNLLRCAQILGIEIPRTKQKNDISSPKPAHAR